MMKTSKETQLEILNKMIENVENGNDLLKDIQYRNGVTLEWDDRLYDIGQNHFKSLEMRVKPETIKINGVDIPKPISKEDLVDSNVYFYVCADKYLYDTNSGRYIKDYGVNFVYETVEEAIEASKLLFGLGDYDENI